MEHQVEKRNRKDQGAGRRNSQGTRDQGLLYKRRRSNQMHRGGKKSKRRPQMQIYVAGYQGNTRRRDLSQVRRQWQVLRKRVVARSKKNRKRRIVGTKGRLGQRREKWTRENQTGRIYVTKGWESGRLTNMKKVTKTKRPGIPGRMRFRHTQDQGTARSEAMACGIPTAGIFQADGEKEIYEKRTYVIPGNEGSRRGARRRAQRVKVAYQGRGGEGNEA